MNIFDSISSGLSSNKNTDHSHASANDNGKERFFLEQTELDFQHSHNVWKILLPLIRPHLGLAFSAVLILAVSSLATLVMPWLVGATLDVLFSGKIIDNVPVHLAWLFGLVLLVGFSSALRSYLMSVLGYKVAANLRESFYAITMRRPMSFFDNLRAGDFGSNIIVDINIIGNFVGSKIATLVKDAALLVGGITLLIVMSVKLVALALLTVPLVLCVLYFFGQLVAKSSKSAQDAMARLLTKAIVNHEAVSSIRAFGQERAEALRFSDAIWDAFEKHRILCKWRAVMNAALTILIFSAIGVMIVKGAMEVVAGSMTGGEVAKFIGLSVIVASAIDSFREFYGEFQAAKGAIHRLSSLSLSDQETLEPSPKSTIVPWNLKRPDIEFHNVSFAYPSNPEKKVLKEVNIRVNSGETVALVGPSGCGKSTLFKLLMRFYEPHSGEILIDGKSINKLDPRSVRSRFALIPQESHIFGDTVLANIGFGKPDTDLKAIKRATNQAGANNFIRMLPQEFLTVLSERGTDLSGGQRQRIAIARALLRDASILLLDEATSALDAESEQLVHNALKKSKAGCTKLIITHRLSTIKNVDRVILMNSGCVIDSGTHSELIERNALYQRLAKLQNIVEATSESKAFETCGVTTTPSSAEPRKIILGDEIKKSEDQRT
ncbi:ABC transporter [Microbulbifer sp. A4B17]|uniref:ABC transporter ATP-binding protein n=1 Tax=Microbulbifer sp. A4B17 TaxID=359370 RepID=UPI000D52D517|nr:ATP-binding cassette domain-containing protein [Microbulbifer sp. A4B17]AWF80207.1 ABC transporter [Microbulbifer sp. A4B17]